MAENQAIILGPYYTFSNEVEKQREIDRIEELELILNELDNWRAESLYAPIILNYRRVA